MRTLILLLALMSSHLLVGQNFGKGTKLIGGGIGASFNETSAPASVSKSTFISISPNYGYFLTPNLVGGIGILLTSNNQDTDFRQTSDSYDRRNYGVGATPFVRYYFTGNFFTSASFGIRYQNQTENFVNAGDESEIKTDITTYTYSGSFGYDFFIRENIAIEGSLTYLHSDTKQGFTFKNNSISLGVGLQFFLD